MTDRAEADVPTKPGPTLRASLLDEAFAASTPTNQAALGGGELFRKRRVTIAVPAHMCSQRADGQPVFPEDFELTLAELDAASEMNACSGVESKAEIAFLYAKASLHGVNGKPISTVHRDWLWDALGMGGRTLAIAAFYTHLAPASDEEGKARIDAAVLAARVE